MKNPERPSVRVDRSPCDNYDGASRLNLLTMTMNHQPFLDDIRHCLDDDNPRLIYADWLTEHGDPRGEFIRMQCRRATLSFDDLEYWLLRQQEQAMLVKHRETWAGDVAYLVNELQFHRGFPSRIRIAGDEFLKNADQVLALTPIEHAVFDFPRTRFLNPNDQVAPLLASDKLDSIDSLFLDLGTLEMVLDSKHISHLKRLNVHAGADNAGLIKALDCNELENLESLTLRGGRLQWYQVFNNPHLKKLKCLRVFGKHSSDRGEEFYQSPMWSQLDCLAIGFDGLNKENVDAFLATSPFANLKSLTVNGNRPHYRELFAENRVEHLLSLSVFRGFSDRIVRQIIDGQLLPNLRVFCCAGLGAISVQGLAQLLDSYVGQNLFALYDGTATSQDEVDELANLKCLQVPWGAAKSGVALDKKFGSLFKKNCEIACKFTHVEDWTPLLV